MGLATIAVIVLSAFLLGFLIYGKIISKTFLLSDKVETPACQINDGVDFIPTRPPILLGQHFAAISAAGPIIGPITAALWFGWGPALLWVVLGAIFIGAFHDFSSLVASIRHHARSVAEIVKDHVGGRAYLLFLIFIWLTLIYVIIAFTDLTARSFLDAEMGGATASSSAMYLILACLMGLALYRWKVPLWLATCIGFSLLVAIIWWGQYVPLRLPAFLQPALTWNVLILGYCFMASVLPMWLLLQPRGYLGGFFLYVALFGGLIGMLFGGFEIRYPIFTSFFNPQGQPLFPIMFVTIACGACSGFHGLVSSGTTSKQISKETHSRLVGYGGMLLEGVVALIALATVMMVIPGTGAKDPNIIFAQGLGKLISVFGISPQFAVSFGMLAFATFIFDTLDVTTRLGRYIFQELTGWQEGRVPRYVSTLVTLVIPLAYILSTTVQDPSVKTIPAWQRIWPVFGTANQLLAALTLLGITVWLRKTRHKAFWLTIIPTTFMFLITLSSLGLMISTWVKQMMLQGSIMMNLNSMIALVLLVLAILLIRESAVALQRRNS